MKLTCTPRPIIKLATSLFLAIGLFFVTSAVISDVASAAVRFGIRYQDRILTNQINPLTVLPGETMSFEVADPDPALNYVAHPTAGRLVSLSTGSWVWTSPRTPGLYPIRVAAPDSGEEIILQAFVVVPVQRLRGEFLNGYRIGRYPAKKTLSERFTLPGFIEVTQENEDTLITPNFRLNNFYANRRPAHGSTSC
jgi:hypothetical protein